MKKFIAIVFAVLLAVSAFSGCKKKVSDTEQTLEIYTLFKGYGVGWTEALIEEFKKQDWVQDKYPELIIEFGYDDIDATPHNKINMGKAANTVDLMFSSALTTYAGNPQIADITDSVYKSQVPGENVTVIEKMLPGFAESNAYIAADGSTKYYNMTYVSGLYGILYNADILEDLGLSVPLTTDHFIETMESVKKLNKTNPAYSQTYSIMSAAQDGYWYPMFSTWWAQYEGLGGYSDFYEGIYDNSISKDIFRQTGRLESLKVLESIFAYENGYVNPTALSDTWDIAQPGFLTGNGLFHYNGDYFVTEMETTKEALKEDGYDYEIKYMKNPVISSIVDRLPSVKTTAASRGVSNDEMLRLLIAEIDGGSTATSYSGVSEADYKSLTEARNMIQSSGSLTGIIPDYANGKEVAIDFLRFMATDIAFESVLAATKGLMLPFEYDVKEKNYALYETLDPAQKVKIDLYSDKVMPVVHIPQASSFILGKNGLRPLASIEYNNKVAFEANFGKSSNRDTAQGVFNGDIVYWNDTRWNQLISAAGLL